MQSIYPFLWFDHQAEEAAAFYTSIFPNSRIGNISRYTEGGMGTPGSVMSVGFSLNGQEFGAVNGGPLFTFSEAISLVIPCESQAEVDYFWEKLGVGGQEQQCGWIKDRYGVSWQVVPVRLYELMNDPNPQKAAAVTSAMLKMVKLDLNLLEQAHQQA